MRSASNRLDSFFFNDTATTEIYTLSLHDALPIWSWRRRQSRPSRERRELPARPWSGSWWPPRERRTRLSSLVLSVRERKPLRAFGRSPRRSAAVLEPTRRRAIDSHLKHHGILCRTAIECVRAPGMKPARG